MKKTCNIALALIFSTHITFGQNVKLNNQTFELKNVTGSVINFNGEKVLKIERDLKALTFDVKNLEATVDEPTYAKLTDLNFQDGVIEVKVLSRIQDPSPFEFAQGFIGVAFRINENDSAYESIYLRPRVGRSENQMARNRTVQYYAYPDYKFDRLRKEADGMYETTADVGLNEWITMRIEVEGQNAYLFINDAKHATFVVNKMKGATTNGSVALWVDIGTIGYFKDLKVSRK